MPAAPLTPRNLRLRAILLGVLWALPGKAQDRQLCQQSYTGVQEAQKKKRLREARGHATECLRSCTGALASDCLQWGREVDGALPSVVFRARRAGGRELEPVSVLVGGAELTARLDGKSLELDPGSYSFEFRFEQERVVQSETIREGEKNRLIEVEFPPLPAANVSPPDPPPPSSPLPPTPPVTTPPPATAPPRRSPWLWPLVAVGGVALAGSGALGYTTLLRAKELRDRCAPACPGDEVDSLYLRRTTADVLLGVGVLSLGGAVYLAWFHGPAAVSVGPRWFGVSGRFLPSRPVSPGLRPDVTSGGMIYSFGAFLLDTTNYELRRGQQEISVQPRVFDLIAYLVTNHARVVTKDELLKNVWGGVAVSEASLTQAIMMARRTLDSETEYIQTVRGRGYRFAGEPGTGAAMPDLTPSGSRDPPSSPGRGALFGREPERRLLEEALRALLGGKGGTLLLAGEPGSGKTRLLEELSTMATGARVLWGRCLPTSEGTPALWPWIQILRGLAREGGPGADLRGAPGAGPRAGGEAGRDPPGDLQLSAAG
jgi:DNA-binding winged helix-turn-helix (wHTH) protein